MSSPSLEIRVGLGSCGIASGAEEVRAAFEEALRDSGGRAVLKPVGCNGMCHHEPLVEVVDLAAQGGGGRTLYGGFEAGLVPAALRRHLAPQGLAERLARALTRRGLVPALTEHALPTDRGPAAAYLGKQRRIVLENCGEIDPFEIEDSLARDGYRALTHCLTELTPDALVELVSASGLRGRGGAGFPTGTKWRFARAQPGSERVVICNGDEGDPGAFMDRSILEGDPHRVLEGLAIAAYATGARRGFFYVRSEYPHAVRRLRAAIEQARERGFLGQGIAGSDFDLELEVREGAGAFVCGEETALIASIEGRRGTPRLRPPFPVERGYQGLPTTINNVETLACLPWIVRHGAEAFAELGTETSKGTKVFALAGKIRRGGLIEVPMGITIREVVEEIGGGIVGGRALKAVQMGGPSGGCLPADLADTPIDYEELARTGAIMGSGGMVVLDERDCMVDMARFFLDFTQAESCGKCTFCRIGTRRMLEILERICRGEGRERDLDDLEELADRVQRASLCGLGQTAPNPVLTTLRYFRQEYEAHVREGRCPAGSCPDLITYRITEACIGCTMCAQVCPVDAIAYQPHERHSIDEALCTRCDMCYQACEDDAIEIV